MEGWAELQSSRKPQVRTKHTTGMDKRPVGKVRDTALKDKARGKLAAGRVLVYSYGDEMYRKVAARTLIPFTPQALERPYGKMSIEAALKSFNKRGFNGKQALEDAKQELEQRRRVGQAARDQAAFRQLH